MADDTVVGDNGPNEPKIIKVNYNSNSHKSKEAGSKKPDKPKQEKVISGEVVQRKKGLWEKIKETFTGDDLHSVGNFIMFDVVLPAAKQMISDAVSQGVERTLFGESARRANRPSMGSRYTNYSSYSKPSVVGRAAEPDAPRSISSRARAAHDFDEIVLGSRGEAEEVLDRLTDLVSNYDVATVSDLYDLVGITGSFTDDKWGWYDLRGSSIRPVRGGYLLILPKTAPIE